MSGWNIEEPCRLFLTGYNEIMGEADPSVPAISGLRGWDLIETAIQKALALAGQVAMEKAQREAQFAAVKDVVDQYWQEHNYDMAKFHRSLKALGAAFGIPEPEQHSRREGC